VTDFLSTMQRLCAREAVGVTALRGQAPGTLRTTHAFLDALDLSKVPKGGSPYVAWLDKTTLKLVNQLPGNARPWGTARKALNLFMRTSLYNRYMNKAYRLDRAEAWMEIALDSAVAHGLKKESGRGQLPFWPGLKQLRKPVSEKFQAFAQKMADQRRIAKVHLDMYLWLENR